MLLGEKKKKKKTSITVGQTSPFVRYLLVIERDLIRFVLVESEREYINHGSILVRSFFSRTYDCQ